MNSVGKVSGQLQRLCVGSCALVLAEGDLASVELQHYSVLSSLGHLSLWQLSVLSCAQEIRLCTYLDLTQQELPRLSPPVD